MARNYSMLGLGWEHVLRFQGTTERKEYQLGETKRKLMYWFKQEGGGALTKQLAQDLANYMRTEMYNGNAFDGFPPLHRAWVKKKHDLQLDPRMGIATGRLADAIRPVKQNNYWRVSVSENDTGGSEIGKIDSVKQYAYYLEHGYRKRAIHYSPVSGKWTETTYKQPPRPFFSTTFLRWARDKVPRELHKEFLEEFDDDFQKISQEMGKYVARYSARDLVRTSRGGSGSEAAEILQETTQRGGTGFEASPAAEMGSTEAEGKMTSMDTGGTSGPSYDSDEEEAADVVEDVTSIEKPPGYPESQRVDEYAIGAKGRKFTFGGDVFNEYEDMWQDYETFSKRIQRYERDD